MSYTAAQIRETFKDLEDSELRSRVRREWNLTFPPRLSRDKMEAKIAEYLNDQSSEGEGPKSEAPAAAAEEPEQDGPASASVHPPAASAPPSEPILRVRAKPRRKMGRWRAGLQFDYRQWRELKLSDLSADAVNAIEADPELECVRLGE